MSDRKRSIKNIFRILLENIKQHLHLLLCKLTSTRLTPGAVVDTEEYYAAKGDSFHKTQLLFAFQQWFIYNLILDLYTAIYIYIYK